MLKLYGGARSRASIIQWYLEELNVPYEFVLLDMAAQEQRQPPYLAINPIGKVPAIVDEDFKLWESGAILLYLAEKYGKMPASLQEKSVITQWVLFANATLGVGLFVPANAEKEAPRLLSSLNDIFSRQPFILGDEFTVADVAVGSILAYVPMMLKMDLSPYPQVLNYLQTITERPAFAKTIGKRS